VVALERVGRRFHLQEAFEAGGGKVIKEMSLPFPQVEFQSYLTEIAALKPDVVYVFFAGGGAVKFVKDYAAAGLNKTIPLVGPGFLTDGTLEAQGDSAQGLLTTLHYGDGLNIPKNNAFRGAYTKAFTWFVPLKASEFTVTMPPKGAALLGENVTVTFVLPPGAIAPAKLPLNPGG
jgi:ABC-type branched-subunit amino acid transport system substrate-binding protein